MQLEPTVETVAGQEQPALFRGRRSSPASGDRSSRGRGLELIRGTTAAAARTSITSGASFASTSCSTKSRTSRSSCSGAGASVCARTSVRRGQSTAGSWPSHRRVHRRLDAGSAGRAGDSRVISSTASAGENRNSAKRISPSWPRDLIRSMGRLGSRREIITRWSQTAGSHEVRHGLGDEVVDIDEVEVIDDEHGRRSDLASRSAIAGRPRRPASGTLQQRQSTVAASGANSSRAAITATRTGRRHGPFVQRQPRGGRRRVGGPPGDERCLSGTRRGDKQRER